MFSRVYVEITNICNMNCSFCHGHSREPRHMTEEEFSHILDQLSGQTEYIYYHLMGEPLTHPLLPRFLQMARERGFRSVLTTNGTLLHKRGEALISAGVHKVSLSVHSFEGRDPAAQRDYLQKLCAFVEAASAAGIIVVFRLWNKGVDNGNNDDTVAFLRGFFPEEWAENTRGYRIRKKLFLEWGDRFEWPDVSAPLQEGGVFCYGMTDHFGILCDGSVVPCCMDSEGVIPLGNVFTEELSHILSSPRACAIAEGFREKNASEDLCRRCAYARKFYK